MSDTFDAKVGYAVADGLRAAADELPKLADGFRLHIDASVKAAGHLDRLKAMGDLLSALADALDEPPNITRPAALREAARHLRGMCKHP